MEQLLGTLKKEDKVEIILDAIYGWKEVTGYYLNISSNKKKIRIAREIKYHPIPSAGICKDYADISSYKFKNIQNIIKLSRVK